MLSREKYLSWHHAMQNIHSFKTKPSFDFRIPWDLILKVWETTIQ